MLTRQGYLINKEELTQSYVKELTISPIATSSYLNKDVTSFQVFTELGSKVAVPRYWAQKRFGSANTFIGKVCIAPNLLFNGFLRSDQVEASKRSVKKLQKDGGGVLCLPTGTGKTVIALHVACSIRVKTLIVVHKTFLMDQWIDRITQFVPLAIIGKIQQKTIKVTGCDIVVGMLQSIAMRQYNPKVFDNFGLIIFDEVHVVPSPVFSRALFKVCSPCMLGLSATPERTDGLSHVISMFVGPIFMQQHLTKRSDVKVIVVSRNFRCVHKKGITRICNALCNDIERNNLLVKIVVDLVDIKRNVILLSDRRNHCTKLKNLLVNNDVHCGLYIGGMSKQELKMSETGNVLLATYAMAKEGLDLPHMNSLVLATPRSNVVQACGRILHGKKCPIIIDVVDRWWLGNAQFNKRNMYYKASGFSVDN